MSDSIEHPEKGLAEDLSLAAQGEPKNVKADKAKADKEKANIDFMAGQLAFERGNYRASVNYFEEALTLVSRGTVFEGEIQLWLANAYAAVGEMEVAIATCQKLARHPDPETRKQGKRLAYILQAPKLQAKEEWLTKIPDLKDLDGQSSYDVGQSPFSQEPKRRRRPRPKPESEPIDMTKVKTQDNQFMWFALILSLLVLGGLWWFS